jgi:circadian clock protein KaiB
MTARDDVPPASSATDDEQLPAYDLRLYITGMTPRSSRAIERVRSLCETLLHGRYDLKIVDLYDEPGLASTEQIVAAPTLIRRLPEPVRRIVGDMSNEARVVAGLGLYEAR